MQDTALAKARFSRVWMVTALLSSTAAFVPAVAQTAPPGPASAPDAGDAVVPEIVVTAQKRSENLQKVPISIQALGTATLEQHQIASFDDYAKLLPSVSYQSFGPGQSQLYFRGISSGGDGSRTGPLPGSGLYLDEIPVTTIAGSVDVHVYDIARVEALSGPQGTLFGASSLSGTLRIITNQPELGRLSAGLDVQGTSYGRGSGSSGGNVEGYVNIPLSDRAAIRLVGFYEHDGGFIDNIPATRTYTLSDDDPTNDITINNDRFAKQNFNRVDTYGGRAALKIDLDDNWTVTPTVIYQHQQAKGTFLYDPKVGDLAVADYSPEYNDDRWVQAALVIQGKLSNWDVVYAGGYFDRQIDNQSDYSDYTVAYDSIPGYTSFPTTSGGFLDPTQFNSSTNKYTKQSHELRISSPASDRLRIVAGLFYQRQTDRIRDDYFVSGLAATGSSQAIPKAGDDIFLNSLFRVDRDYAAFGEASFDLLPNLTLAGGIRGFIVRNSLIGFSGTASRAADTALCIPTFATDRPCDNVHALDGSDTPRFVNQSGETHKVNLTWKVDPDRLVYATWSTGYRPGGINRLAQVAPYRPDTLTNYELGFKTSWLDRRLRLNGALFIENWKGIQYTLTSVGDNGQTSNYNAGNARVHGVEADFALRVIPGLSVSGSGTYIDAKLTTNFCTIDATGAVRFQNCALGVAAKAGTALPVQPRFKGNLTVRYERPIGATSAFVQASANHQSSTRSYLTNAEADQFGPTAGFSTFDFAVGTTFTRWTVEAFVQNAFDKRGALSINTVCAPSICGAYARTYTIKPRLFGMKIGTKF